MTARPLFLGRTAASTPAGTSSPALVNALGAALFITAIWLVGGLAGLLRLPFTRAARVPQR